MQRKILIGCLTILFSSCVLLPLERNFLVDIKTRNPAFNLQNAAGVKMAILPVRDFSDHYSIGYSSTVMGTFVKEIKRRSPQLEITEPEAATKLLESTGMSGDYQLMLYRCDMDRKYCLEREEMLRLFKNSGIRYVASLIVSNIDIPIAGSVLSYSFSVIVYDMSLDGQVVYQATCEGEVYPDILEEGPGVYLDNVMEDVTKAVVAKMYPEPEENQLKNQLKQKVSGWF